MATRSTIALEYADGTVDQVYCHWDGYLEGVGQKLEQHWRDPSKLQEIMDLGDLSSLGSELGEKHCFDNPHPYGSQEYKDHEAKCGKWCLFYGRDRGEEDTKARRFWNFEMYRMSGQSEEYDYVLRNINGQAQWFVRFDNAANEFVPLKPQLKE